MKALLVAWLVLGTSAEFTTEAPWMRPIPPDPGVVARTAVFDDIFNNYNAQMYPENMTLKFGIELIHVDLDADEGIMESHVMLRMKWNDTRLKWDENLTSVDSLRVSASQIWTPDIAVWNAMSPQMTLTDFPLVIYSTGEVIWVPQTTIKSFCQFTYTNNDPFEERICPLKFASWSHSGSLYDIQPYNDKLSADMSNFWIRKYNVTTNTAKRYAILYTCCHEAYLDITYILGLTRIAKTNGTYSNGSE